LKIAALLAAFFLLGLVMLWFYDGALLPRRRGVEMVRTLLISQLYWPISFLATLGLVAVRTLYKLNLTGHFQP
jgi:hypothetical protein